MLFFWAFNSVFICIGQILYLYWFNRTEKNWVVCSVYCCTDMNDTIFDLHRQNRVQNLVYEFIIIDHRRPNKITCMVLCSFLETAIWHHPHHWLLSHSFFTRYIPFSLYLRNQICNVTFLFDWKRAWGPHIQSATNWLLNFSCYQEKQSNFGSSS